jgi:hypothetical protein
VKEELPKIAGLDDLLKDLISTYRSKLVPCVQRARKDGTVVFFHVRNDGKYMLRNCQLSSLVSLWGEREPPKATDDKTMLVVVLEPLGIIEIFDLSLYNLVPGGSA